MRFSPSGTCQVSTPSLHWALPSTDNTLSKFQYFVCNLSVSTFFTALVFTVAASMAANVLAKAGLDVFRFVVKAAKVLLSRFVDRFFRNTAPSEATGIPTASV